MDDSSINFRTLKNHQKWQNLAKMKTSLVQKLTDESSVKEAGEFGRNLNTSDNKDTLKNNNIKLKVLTEKWFQDFHRVLCFDFKLHLHCLRNLLMAKIHEFKILNLHNENHETTYRLVLWYMY